MPAQSNGAAPRKGGGNRHHKLSCNGCGAIVRMTRKALAQMGAPPSCGCGFGPMVVASLEVAASALPDHVLADQPDYRVARAAEARKALAEHQTTGVRMQCGGCRVFIPSARHACRCGFKNDIRGGRNEGRWVSGSARCAEWEDDQAHKDAMPF